MRRSRAVCIVVRREASYCLRDMLAARLALLALLAALARASMREPAAYAVEHATLLNEAERRDREVGLHVRAALRLRPAWAAADQLLLQFELLSPKLYGRGKHVNADFVQIESVWDAYPHSTFYAHWKEGLIQQVYLDPDELIDIQNFKRSLISLFQFQVAEGQRNETDATGQCEVQYEAPSETTVRKVKRRCRSAGWAPGGAGARRLARYSLAGGALREAHAEELLALGAAPLAALKVRAWLRATRTEPAPPPLAPHRSLADALAALPPQLRAAPLPVPPPRADAPAADASAPAPSDSELTELARRAGHAAPGHGGSLRAARAALALMAAPPARLAALLRDGADADALAGLCAALGLVASAPAHGAAAAFLRLRHADAPQRLARVYFAALALAPGPADAVVDDALALGDDLPDAALADAALLAGAAAASRASPAAQERARARLVRGLARCAHDACRAVRAAALANLRRADAAEPLLRLAERGGAAGEAALDALDELAAAHGAPAGAAARLERLALGAGPAELRAAALDLLLLGAAEAPWALPRVLLRLREQRAGELLRLAWQRLRALAERHEPVRLLLRLLPPELRGWDARAPAGTSALLLRELAARGGWRAQLESRQLAGGAALRRGRVRVLALAPDGARAPALGVELRARGLGALAGDAGDADDGEAPGAALALAVGGARLPELPLFAGRAELLGHVWAGSASEPTPVLRALWPLAGARVALPLLGGAALRFEQTALLAAALDADAQASLWARTARARLSLRAALAARGEARVRAAWGALDARGEAELEPRMRIGADADFYDGAALCVRVRVDDYGHSCNVTLASALGEAPRRVRRVRARRWAAPGRTLALGAPNDATCRTLGGDD